ncbi:MAG: SET domain-containing protein-lysine N-methyltransferase [Vicinamibacterales bacterium]
MSKKRARVEVTETGVRIIRKKSTISGWGVYAAEPINKNKRILQYTGEKISSAEADRRETRYQKNGQIWCFTLNRRWYRDGNVGGSTARFINHSCKGNCYSEVVDYDVWIRASRNIAKGDELSYDYNTEGEAGLVCRCHPGCTNKI